MTPKCQSITTEVADDENESTVNDSIKDLFHRGYPYNEIVGMLAKQGVVMHIHTLKKTKRFGAIQKRMCGRQGDITKCYIQGNCWYQMSCWILKCLACTPIETPNPCAKK